MDNSIFKLTAQELSENIYIFSKRLNSLLKCLKDSNINYIDKIIIWELAGEISQNIHIEICNYIHLISRYIK